MSEQKKPIQGAIQDYMNLSLRLGEYVYVMDE